MEFDPRELTFSQRYKLLTGGILPRPIAVVSTLGPDGTPNLAPFSFFAGVGSDPMTLLFCPANDAEGKEKDSLRNAKPVAEGGRGEFVVNVAPDAWIERIAATAEPLAPDQSEFEFAGLGQAPSVVVAPPRWADSPVSYECKTLQVIRTRPGAPAGGNVVLGEVVHAFVRDDLFDADRFRVDVRGLDLVGRLAGFAYCRTRDQFEVRAGEAALHEGRRELP